MEKIILGFCLSKRVNAAPRVQEILTKYGCSIKTRIGLHDTNGNYCSPDGVIILELGGEREDFPKLEQELRSIEGLKLEKMMFERD